MIDVWVRLTVRDLLPADLASCGWSGAELHLAGVARQLERSRLGEVDYLAVCTATDVPVAKGGVDHRARTPDGRHLRPRPVRPGRLALSRRFPPSRVPARRNRWVTPTGKVRVYVGRSVAYTGLAGGITVF